ncbi:MAG: sporulation protein YqfC [Bacillota bacterium]
MNKKSKNIKETISNVFDLPKDIVMDVSKVVIIGTAQVSVENHKGIIEYSEEQIRVNSGTGIIKINGSNLNIKTIFQEEIIIEGVISGVEL